MKTGHNRCRFPLADGADLPVKASAGDLACRRLVQDNDTYGNEMETVPRLHDPIEPRQAEGLDHSSGTGRARRQSEALAQRRPDRRRRLDHDVQLGIRQGLPDLGGVPFFQKGGRWVPLGAYRFDTEGGSVTLSAEELPDYVVAEAVRFTPAP